MTYSLCSQSSGRNVGTANAAAQCVAARSAAEKARRKRLAPPRRLRDAVAASPSCGAALCELRHALHQLGGVGRRLGRRARARTVEAEPILVAAAPGHLCLERDVLLRQMQVDDVGDGDGLREDDARAFVGEIADETAHDTAALVEMDKAAQEAFQPSGL